MGLVQRTVQHRRQASRRKRLVRPSIRTMDPTTDHAPSRETQRPNSPGSSPNTRPRRLGTCLLPTIQERPRSLRGRLVERRQLGRRREETRKGQTLTPPSPPPLPFSSQQPKASPSSSQS